MTIEKICDRIAEKIGDKALFDADKFAKGILQANDNNQIKAALTLERVCRPEYLPEDFDPYEIDTGGYVLICISSDGSAILFFKHYPDRYHAQKEMEAQFEFSKNEDYKEVDGELGRDSACLSYDDNRIVDGYMQWNIIPVNQTLNNIDGYEPIQ